MELRGMLGQLNDLRHKAASLKSDRDRAWEYWKVTHAELLSNLALTETSVSEKEYEIKAEALRLYNIDPSNRKPASGVEIKIFEELDYEIHLALIWAKEHDMALMLDTKAFEKIAKASPMEFVQIVQVPKCQIASDLEKVNERTNL